MKSKPFDADELNLIALAQEYADEDKARALMESLRWPNGIVCPHCRNKGEKPISKLEATTESVMKNKGVRKGVYFCGACRQQFTVTVGTVFESSHVPLSKWAMALFIMCSAKKSVSSNQLHRMLGVTYKTAWFMTHRIRVAMTPNHWAEPKLQGTVEVDETFVGPRSDTRNSKRSKMAVVGLIERDGPVDRLSHFRGCLRWKYNRGPGVHRRHHTSGKPLKTNGTHRHGLRPWVHLRTRQITGAWTVNFPPKWGAPGQITLDSLMSLSESASPGVKYFSGTATYTKTFDWKPEAQTGKQKTETWLDLGDVQVMAQVKLNGRGLGTFWEPPFRVNATEALKAGHNTLEIRVANLWPSRMIGDASLPPDQRFTWSSYEPFTKDSPLLKSGLIGPVMLRSRESVDVR